MGFGIPESGFGKKQLEDKEKGSGNRTSISSFFPGAWCPRPEAGAARRSRTAHQTHSYAPPSPCLTALVLDVW